MAAKVSRIAGGERHSWVAAFLFVFVDTILRERGGTRGRAISSRADRGHDSFIPADRLVQYGCVDSRERIFPRNSLVGSTRPEYPLPALFVGDMGACSALLDSSGQFVAETSS